MIKISLFTSLVFLSLCLGACSVASQPPPKSPSSKPPVAPKQGVSLSQPAASPGPSTIQTVVRERHGDLRQCYIAGALSDSSLAGTVNVVFTIETDGSVSTIGDAGSDLADQGVVACVLSVFSELRFPKGGASPTEVTYPVRFGSRG